MQGRSGIQEGGSDMVKDLSVDLCGVRLKNPVVPASGTFGFGLELAGDMDLNVLGGISLKGTTREARYGNPTPRIAECEGGMINSVGLQNPGIDVLVGEKVPALRKVYDGCVIANISGFSLDEYVECCEKPQLFAGRVRGMLRQGRCLRGNRHHRGQCLLPERAQRRDGLRDFGRFRGGSDRGREGGLPQAGLPETEPERDGHRLDRPGVRGRGRRRPHSSGCGSTSPAASP